MQTQILGLGSAETKLKSPLGTFFFFFFSGVFVSSPISVERTCSYMIPAAESSQLLLFFFLFFFLHEEWFENVAERNCFFHFGLRDKQFPQDATRILYF